MRASDHKNVDLYTLNRDVIRGQAHGMVLWQPRTGAWFDDRDYLGIPYPAPFTGLSYEQAYRDLGCSDRLYWHYCCFEKVYPASVRETTVQHDPLKTERVIETPVGRVNQISVGNTSNGGTFPVKWWVTEEEDLEVFIWLEEHTEWRYNHQTYLNGLSASREFGYPITMMPRVNIQNLFLDLMGVEEAVYALYDYPETVEKYFTALSESQHRMMRLICQSPIEQVNFGDNLHCKMLPPDLFKKYVLPEYQKRNELLHAAGKFTSSHWDGDTELLLPLAKETGLDAIEAITPIPQGDVTLEQMKKGLGDDIFLMDGIPALLFEESYPLEQLRETTLRLMELFAPKLILGISDEISSNGQLERIALVRELVDDYNARVTIGQEDYLRTLRRESSEGSEEARP